MLNLKNQRHIGVNLKRPTLKNMNNDSKYKSNCPIFNMGTTSQPSRLHKHTTFHLSDWQRSNKFHKTMLATRLGVTDILYTAGGCVKLAQNYRRHFVNIYHKITNIYIL